MLSEDSKKTIDALTKEDLLYEVNRGGRSRFQRENFDYVKTRLALLEQQRHDHDLKEQLGLNAEANQIAKKANELSDEANTTSKKAYRMSAISTVVAVVALFVALVPQCTSGR